MRPELQSTIFTHDYQLGEYAQRWNESVDTTHASMMLFAYAFSTGWPDPGDRARASAGERRMGYDLWVSDVAVNFDGGGLRKEG